MKQILSAAAAAAPTNTGTGRDIKSAATSGGDDRDRDPIRVPVFAVVDYVTDLLSFIEKHGFPCVIKPRSGHSSIGAAVLKDHNSLTRYLLSLADTKTECDRALSLDIERFVSGSMYHIDGLVIHGQVKVIWPSRYVNACVGFDSNPYLASISLSPPHPIRKRLQHFIARIIAALIPDTTPPSASADSKSAAVAAPTATGDNSAGGGSATGSCGVSYGPTLWNTHKPSFSFHAEAWHDPQTDLITLCEIASRTGGADVCDQFRELMGVHLHQSNAQLQSEDVLTNPKLYASAASATATGSEERWPLPVSKHCIGWCWVYPPRPHQTAPAPALTGSGGDHKTTNAVVGTTNSSQAMQLTHIPSDCDLDCVLSYQAMAKAGDVFNGAASCVDSVAGFLYRCDSDSDAADTVDSIFHWFTTNAKYQPTK